MDKHGDWLHSCTNPGIAAASRALMRWIAPCGCFECILFDLAPHRIALQIKWLEYRARRGHHFTTAFCPCLNGTDNHVCKGGFPVCKAKTFELKFAPHQWSWGIDGIQTILNKLPSNKLEPVVHGTPQVLTPLEIFTGKKPTLLTALLMPLKRFKELKAITEQRIENRGFIGCLKAP